MIQRTTPAIALLTVTLLLTVGTALAGEAIPAVTVHVERRGDWVCEHSLPSLTKGDLRPTFDGVGEIDAFVVISGFDEIKVMSFGMTWPEAWGSGIWRDCAYLKMGNIAMPGDMITIAWEHCIKGEGPFVVGWLMLTATTPGTVEVIAARQEGGVALVDCNEVAPSMREALINLKAGIGGVKGDNTALLNRVANRTWFITPDSAGSARTVNEALRMALPGDTVLVAAGTYRESISLKYGVVVLGSWDPSFTRRDLGLFPSVINASGHTMGVRSSFGEDSLTVFDCFVITGASGGRGGGGLVMTSGSSPTVRNLIIHSNLAEHGGGIFCHASSPVIDGVLITRNVAERGGGVFCTMGSSPRLRNLTIVDNEASRGAAISASRGSSPYVENSIIADHSRGCAIHTEDETSRVSVACCDLWSNLPSDLGGRATEAMLLRDNLSEDPRFVDPSRLDFTLGEGSPCLSVKDCGRLGAAYARVHTE